MDLNGRMIDVLIDKCPDSRNILLQHGSRPRAHGEGGAFTPIIYLEALDGRNCGQRVKLAQRGFCSGSEGAVQPAPRSFLEKDARVA